MVAIERYGEGEGEDSVGSREVVSPEERLSAKLNCRWEEREHGDEHRHLEEHGQTAREGACAGTAIESHSLLLTFESVGLIRIFLVDFLDFRRKNTHFGLTLVALECEGEDDELDEECEQEDDEAIAADKLAEESEYGDYYKDVNPAEETPAEGDEAGELEVFIVAEGVVEIGEDGVVVGAEIPIEACRCAIVDGVGDGGGHRHVLEIVGSLDVER